MKQQKIVVILLIVIIALFILITSACDPVNVRVINWDDNGPITPTDTIVQVDTLFLTDTIYIPKDTLTETIWVFDTVYSTEFVYRDTCDPVIEYDTLYLIDATGNLATDRLNAYTAVFNKTIPADKRITSQDSELEKQLRVLYGFITGINYEGTRNDVNRINWPPEARGMCWTNYDEYFFYLTSPEIERIQLKIKPGTYVGNYINPATGLTVKGEEFTMYEPLYYGWIQPSVFPPDYEDDIVLYLNNQDL